MTASFRPRVLVVDDAQSGRLYLKMVLGSWPLEVVQAESGQAAVARCAEGIFDLIFMDLHMPPGIEGVEATRLIRRQSGGARVPVIVYTSDSAYEDPRVWSDAGFDGYLPKGASGEMVQGILERWGLLET